MFKIGFITLISAIFAAAFVVACAKKAPEPEQKGPVASVWIDSAGVIQLNGQTVTLAELRQRLTVVRDQGGSVRYSRANPAGDPPPNAMEALQVVVELQLPVELANGPKS